MCIACYRGGNEVPEIIFKFVYQFQLVVNSVWNNKRNCLIALLKSTTMTDVHNRKTRSYNMSRIRSKNTQPEILVRKFLHSNGLRFRLHDKKLPGRPDIVLPKYKTIVLVHGCFWHGHTNCKDFKIPRTNTEYWVSKIKKNIEKDLSVEKALTLQKWKIIVVWACQLETNKKETNLKVLLSKIVK